MKALVIGAWVLVVLVGLFGIAAVYIAIWTQTDEWFFTALATVTLTFFGGIGAAALTGIASER